jgi:hypothetical protein
MPWQLTNSVILRQLRWETIVSAAVQSVCDQLQQEVDPRQNDACLGVMQPVGAGLVADAAAGAAPYALWHHQHALAVARQASSPPLGTRSLLPRIWQPAAAAAAAGQQPRGRLLTASPGASPQAPTRQV